MAGAAVLKTFILSVCFLHLAISFVDASDKMPVMDSSEARKQLKGNVPKGIGADFESFIRKESGGKIPSALMNPSRPKPKTGDTVDSETLRQMFASGSSQADKPVEANADPVGIDNPGQSTGVIDTKEAARKYSGSVEPSNVDKPPEKRVSFNADVNKDLDGKSIRDKAGYAGVSRRYGSVEPPKIDKVDFYDETDVTDSKRPKYGKTVPKGVSTSSEDNNAGLDGKLINDQAGLTDSKRYKALQKMNSYDAASKPNSSWSIGALKALFKSLQKQFNTLNKMLKKMQGDYSTQKWGEPPMG